MPRVLIPLIDGFEEVEAITPIDLLRRAGIEVVTAGFGKKSATGSHQITVQTDAEFAEVMTQEFDMILLPGGPGTKALRDVAELQQLLKTHAAKSCSLAAICAAPTVLAKAGLLEGKRATCYPSAENLMAGALLVREPVVIDGSIITSRGAGTAVPFALAVIGHLCGKDSANQIAQAIVYSSPA